MRHIIWIAVLLMSPIAKGASFNCAKAATSVERLICSEKDLSSLDDVLADLFSVEADQGERPSRLRTSQKAWLSTRNACADSACIKRRYEQRIAEIACNGRMNGSAIGSSQCSYYTMRVVEQELEPLEQAYGRKVSEQSNNPEYTLRTLEDEQRAWRSYRSAQCALHGALEGGSDGWKNAFAGICELEETRKRLARIKKELSAK